MATPQTSPKTEAAPPPPDVVAAAAAAPPADPETVEREKRLASEKAIRTKTKRLLEAFQSKDVALRPLPSALLAAHVYSTHEKADSMSVKDATEWAIAFRGAHPVLWGALAQMNTMGFLKQLKLHGLDPEGLSDDYVRLASVIGQ